MKYLPRLKRWQQDSLQLNLTGGIAAAAAADDDQDNCEYWTGLLAELIEEEQNGSQFILSFWNSQLPFH